MEQDGEAGGWAGREGDNAAPTIHPSLRHPIILLIALVPVATSSASSLS